MNVVGLSIMYVQQFMGTALHTLIRQPQRFSKCDPRRMDVLRPPVRIGIRLGLPCASTT